MDRTIRSVMNSNPTALGPQATVMEAALAMREREIGDVVILEGGRLCGILTDRDIVVRALALGNDPYETRVADICSRQLTTVSPDESVHQAVQLMRQKAIRRLPVEEGGHVVGIVSLGDLAIELDQASALGEISAAPPNA